jgi:hypothetical protein
MRLRPQVFGEAFFETLWLESFFLLSWRTLLLQFQGCFFRRRFATDVTSGLGVSRWRD